MKIRTHINAFPDAIVITGIDVSTFRFYGPTNGYDHKDNKDCSTIGFVADNAHEIVKAVQATFHLNPEYSKPEDYIWVRDKFDDYEKDKRPRIGIRLPNGIRGLVNPPQFEISND